MLNELPEYALLKAEYLPKIVKHLLNESRVVFCSLEEIPDSIEPGLDYVFIDDAHLLSEPEIF